MKTMKDWKKEADKALSENVNAVIKVFRDQRDQEFLNLENLSQELEKLEAKKKELIAEQEKESKNFIPSNNILNECGRKLHYTNKNIEGIKKQIEALFKKLTSYSESIREIFPFISKLMELKG